MIIVYMDHPHLKDLKSKVISKRPHLKKMNLKISYVDRERDNINISSDKDLKLLPLLASALEFGSVSCWAMSSLTLKGGKPSEHNSVTPANSSSAISNASSDVLWFQNALASEFVLILALKIMQMDGMIYMEPLEDLKATCSSCKHPVSQPKSQAKNGNCMPWIDVLSEFDGNNETSTGPMLQYEWLIGAQYKPLEMVKSDWTAIRKSPPWAFDSWGLDIRSDGDSGKEIPIDSVSEGAHALIESKLDNNGQACIPKLQEDGSQIWLCHL
nr:probable inactive serine/threonine-protein kinase scy1 isoform X2 [Ipomoea batatas]